MATPMRLLATSMSRRLVSSNHMIRGGMGRPVGTLPPPSQPLPEDHELVWDDGTAHPEPAIDHVLPHMSDYKALGMLSGGFGLFITLGLLAAWNDKASRVPFAPREYPYDNLRVELGGDPDA